MFDDPKKELKRLEEELLKNGPEEESFESFYQDVYDEFGPTEEPQIQWHNRTYGDVPRAVAPKEKRRIRGLVIFICLELVVIAGIAGWWLGLL